MSVVATTNMIAALQLLIQYSDKVVAIGKMIGTAQAEGRDVTQAELDVVFADDDAARARLQALIDQHSTGPTG